jgi:hypothetical protein
VSPVAVFKAVTFAVVTRASFGSFTVPRIVPLLFWARAGIENAKIINPRDTNRAAFRDFLMVFSSHAVKMIRKRL